VIDLPNHTYQLRLQLSQRPVQVIQSITLLSGLRLINDFIRKVDIALDQVHIIDELIELSRDTGTVGGATL